MIEFNAVMEKVLALTMWRREQSKNPQLSNREVTEHENELRAQLPKIVALVYNDRSEAYGIFPLPQEAKQRP